LTNLPIKYLEIEKELPIYYQSWWINMVCHNSNLLFSFNEDGGIGGIWPFQIEKKAHLSLIRNPLLTPYWGPYFINLPSNQLQQYDYLEKHAEQLLNQLPKVDYLQFTSFPNNNHFLTFLHHGIHNSCKLTYHIDLRKDTETLLANIQKRRRRYIKNTSEEYIFETNNYNITEILNFHKQAYQRKNGTYPFDTRLTKKLIETCYDNNFGLIHTVKHNSQLLGFLWIVFDKNACYQLLSAHTDDKQHAQAFTQLTWHAILYAKQQQLNTFDFEGSVHKGIEPFFRKFGGTRATYLSFEKNNSIVWTLKRKIFG
jgi:hypothetical protein